MTIQRSTIGGYAMGAAFVLGVATKEWPASFNPNLPPVLFWLAGICGAIGAVLVGTNVSDTSKTVTLDQVQEAANKTGAHTPLTPSMLIDAGPPPEKKEAPPESKF